jgi:hypothetical protein
MVSGTFYFGYKNYSLTNKKQYTKEIIRLENISVKINNTAAKAPSTEGTDQPNSKIAPSQPAQTDFFYYDKWLSLKKTNYIFPKNTATGTDNPFETK